MGTESRRGKGILGLILALAAGAVLLLHHPAAAVNKYWIASSSWWDNGTVWSPAGQPQHGDDVFLTQSDGTNRTVWYSNIAYPSAVLNSLTIDATGSGTMTLNQGFGGYAHPLASLYEYVGYDGTGTHLQSLGTNTVSNELTLGKNLGSSGTYALSGGSLSAPKQYIGLSGIGAFTQTGGTNTLSDSLYLGRYSGSSGTYALSGTGRLSAPIQYIGFVGTGAFTQTGGTNTVSNELYLGYYSGSSGAPRVGAPIRSAIISIWVMTRAAAAPMT